MEENKKRKTRINHLRHFNLAGIKISFRVFIVVWFTFNVGFFRLSREIISVKWNNDISIKKSCRMSCSSWRCLIGVEVFVECLVGSHRPTTPLDEVVFENFAAQIKRQWWMAVTHWHSFPISVACQTQSLNHPLTHHVGKLIIHALWQSSFECEPELCWFCWWRINSLSISRYFQEQTNENN